MSKTNKDNPSRKEVLNSDLLRKGGIHRLRESIPLVCQTCWGVGELTLEGGVVVECPECSGEGAVYD